MSGNRRGKLKEHVEGIHRNCEWIKEHCIQSMALIGDDNKELPAAFSAIGAMIEQLDEFAGSLYTKF